VARRFIEETLHTGQLAYLHAKGLLELDFPVIVKPMSPRYEYVVARTPFVDDAGLFIKLWEPTKAMETVASQVLGDWYSPTPRAIEDDHTIWEAIRRLHQVVSSGTPEAQRQGQSVADRVSAHLTQQLGVAVPSVSFAATAEIYQWLGSLVMPHFLSASIAAASLLLLIGVPRERVCIFGMYYQDPTIFYRPNSDWRAGFLSGTPYYTVMGVFLKSRWLPVDFTVLASGPHRRLQAQPHPHLRHSNLGNHPGNGAPLVVDFAHPYTMICAPAGPSSKSDPVLLTRIPMLKLFGW
jgi:hypothetical protein